MFEDVGLLERSGGCWNSVQNTKHEEGQDVLLWSEADKFFVPVGTDTWSYFVCVCIDSVSDTGRGKGLCKCLI